MHLDDQARLVLARNDRGGYTVPAAGLYPYQWNWDSAFAAWGYSTFDVDRAWLELETLFSAQWENGAVPTSSFTARTRGTSRGRKSGPRTGARRPPGSASRRSPRSWSGGVYEADPDAGRARLAALYPKILAWHRWWRTHRCQSGVAAVTHPWESGRDNFPGWDIGLANVDDSGVGVYTRRDTGHVDPSMRPGKLDYDRYLAILEFGRDCDWDQDEIVARGPFLMADPATTFILMRANRDLAALARTLGEDPGEPEGWAADLEAALPLIWNENLQGYDARDLRTGRFANALGSGAFLAWLAGVESPGMEERLVATWDRVRYGIPSSDPEAPGFDARRYWRGPSWPFMNALIAIGLREAGRLAECERLRRETAALIADGGFYEYFDPYDGTPCGGADFTWTAAVWLAWAGRG